MGALAMLGGWALLGGWAAAQVKQVPGTYTSYAAIRDPITDVNKSFVRIDEANDLTGRTYLTLRCDDRGEPEVWASLNSKVALMTEREYSAGLLPSVTLRLGTQPPTVLRDSDLVAVVNSRQDFIETSLGFQSSALRGIATGFASGQPLIVRVNRLSGGQALTYTFPAKGFAEAWQGVNRCEPFAGRRGATGAAPKFTQWYFGSCRDAASGRPSAGLLAGRAHLCELVIETVPNGAQPVSATFNYELEYREGGRAGKLQLDSGDTWPSGSGARVAYRAEGSKLIFTLPLNVRVRPERVYTSLNVTAAITFDNGATKRVYEPLPVRPAR